MSSTIQIKFLDLEEMANAKNIDWRYEHVGIENLGFADKLKNRVYVRKGLDRELQTLLIDHELSHLFELEGTDEDEHGIRHKKKGGFLSWFVPVITSILGAIAVPGLGAALGPIVGGGLGGLGTGIMTGALGTGAGAMLGGAAGSSMVGKPNWGSNAIGGAGTAAGQIAGSALGGMFPEKSIGSGIAGAAGSALGSSGTQLGLGMLTSPSANVGFNSYNPSGWSSEVAMPTQGSNIGDISAPMSTSSGDRGGLSKMPMDPGLSQAGIDLGNSGRPTQGFSSMFQNMGQGMEIDPTGYNNSNGGMFAF